MSDSGDPHRVLARNAACHQCRRRKLKCDAVRPTCRNCRKPRQRGPEKYEPPEACTWDEARDPSARTLRKRGAKAARTVNHGKPPSANPPPPWANSENAPTSAAGPSSTQPLQHPHQHHPGLHTLPAPQYLEPQHHASVKVDSYHEPMNGYSTGGHATIMSTPMSPVGPSPMSSLHGPNDPPPPPPPPPPSAAQQGFTNNLHWVEPPGLPLVDNMNGNMNYSQPPQLQHQQQHYAAPPVPPGTSFCAPEAPPPQLNPQVSQVMYSDWPLDLPPAATVHDIADTFFARVRVVPRMFHKSTFLANLALPPNHRNFPTRALLHGLLALTAPYIPPERLASRTYFPSGTSPNAVVHPEYDFSPRSTLIPAGSVVTFTPTSIGDGSPLHRFQMWHRRKCYECLSQLVTNGTHLVEAVQSVVCATWVDMNNGWWADVWVESGNAVRMSLPMNLNLSSRAVHDPLSHNIGAILREATSVLEQAQRDRLWWMVFLTERAAASGSLWPNALADDEITVELPVRQDLFDAGIGDLVGVQTLQSPQFYSVHPPQHDDTLSMLIKVSRALSDALTFMRKYSRGLHTFHRYFTDPRFKQVLSNITTLRNSMPDKFKSYTDHTPHGPIVDPDKYTVIDTLHCAVITIGGPLITHQTWTTPAALGILKEIHGVVSNYLTLSQTSYAITNLSGAQAFVWYLAGRNLIRFIAAASTMNAHAHIHVFEADLQNLMQALNRLGERFPVALRYAKVLEGHRAQPIQPIGEIIAMNREENIFDTDYGANVPRKTPSTSSATMSPTAYPEVTPNGAGGSNGVSPPNVAGVSPAVGNLPGPSMPAGTNNVYYPPQDEDSKDMAQWLRNDFDISTYSFDVEAMAQLANTYGPNGPNLMFDGGALAYQH